VFSSGFAIVEQSVSGLGTAFSGVAAVAEDASTLFFNPAGLTRLKGQQAVLGLHYIKPKTEFSDDDSEIDSGSSLSPALTGGAFVALSGSDGGDGGEDAFVPNAYYAANLDNGWAFGIGVNAPFGLATEYADGWQGRYHALRSEVQTVNINPSLAYKVNDHLSLGAGFNAQKLTAELSNAIDFGTIGFATVASSVPLFGAPDPAWMQNRDGKVVLKADDWAYGYNLGLLVEADEETRLGLAYRSRMEYTAKGNADFTVPSTITGNSTVDGGLQAMFADSGAKAEMTLPDSLSVSIYHRFTDRLALMADVTWTNWSVFKELRVEFDNPLKADSVTSYNWNDSWRYSLGGSYDASESLTLRAGVAFDETPIPDDESRTPRIPDEDRFWTSVGACYRFTENLKADFAYAHLFVSDSKIDRQAGVDPSGENFFAGTLVGEFENAVDIASVQLAYNF
jgi:long-chain fatty acid transport protein